MRRRRQVISLPRVRARVTEHVVLERACPKCRKRWAPNPDWSAITVGRQRFGISVQSAVSVLREECRLPFRVIQSYPRSSRGQALKRRFGLGLSVGQIVALTPNPPPKWRNGFGGAGVGWWEAFWRSRGVGYRGLRVVSRGKRRLDWWFPGPGRNYPAAPGRVRFWSPLGRQRRVRRPAARGPRRGCSVAPPPTPGMRDGPHSD